MGKAQNDIMKRKILLIIFSIAPCLSFAQEFSGELTSEWQWDMNKRTNWVNLLRLNMRLPLANGKGAFEAATLHVAKTKEETILSDWQGFSNIETDNMFAAIAVLGYMHTWQNAHLFVGVRNVNEDFFTSNETLLFTNSSCGIFPTIAASYPIANYPFSGLTLYFDVTRGPWTFKNSLYNGTGYNGWKGNDNPFLVRPKRDGVFNISQLEYSAHDARYFAGLTVHTRQHLTCEQEPSGAKDGAVNELSRADKRFSGTVNRSSDAEKGSSASEDDGEEVVSTDKTTDKTTFAWWLYGEQPVWTAGDRSVVCMAQYSENTSHKNECYRYAEMGCAYRNSLNECGLSGQYARFQEGNEWSVELTWRRQLSETIAVQPSFQYVNNANGQFTVLSARLCLSF